MYRAQVLSQLVCGAAVPHDAADAGAGAGAAAPLYNLHAATQQAAGALPLT